MRVELCVGLDSGELAATVGLEKPGVARQEVPPDKRRAASGRDDRLASATSMASPHEVYGVS